MRMQQLGSKVPSALSPSVILSREKIIVVFEASVSRSLLPLAMTTLFPRPISTVGSPFFDSLPIPPQVRLTARIHLPSFGSQAVGNKQINTVSMRWSIVFLEGRAGHPCSYKPKGRRTQQTNLMIGKHVRNELVLFRGPFFENDRLLFQNVRRVLEQFSFSSYYTDIN